jgi:hypothetical protein
VVETSLRDRSGKINIELREIRKTSDVEYAVIFDVNGNSTESHWVKEYGVWRINSFGAAVAGDRSLIEEKDRRRAREERLFTGFSLMIQGGYTSITDRGGGINAALKFGRYFFYDLGLVYALDSDLLNVQFGFGFYIPIRLPGFAIMPLFEFDSGFMSTNGYENDWGGKQKQVTMTRIGVSVQVGLMFTTSALRGLYGFASYQRNFYMDFDLDTESIKPDKSYILLGIGYGI